MNVYKIIFIDGIFTQIIFAHNVNIGFTSSNLTIPVINTDKQPKVNYSKVTETLDRFGENINVSLLVVPKENERRHLYSYQHKENY